MKTLISNKNSKNNFETLSVFEMKNIKGGANAWGLSKNLLEISSAKEKDILDPEFPGGGTK